HLPRVHGHCYGKGYLMTWEWFVVAALAFGGLVATWLGWKRRSKSQGSSPAVSANHSLPTQLEKTRTHWLSGLQRVLGSGAAIDENIYTDLEEVLVTADLGMATTEDLLQRLRQRASRSERKDAAILLQHLRSEILEMLTKSPGNNGDSSHGKPEVI